LPFAVHRAGFKARGYNPIHDRFSSSECIQLTSRGAADTATCINDDDDGSTATSGNVNSQTAPKR